MGSLPNEEPIFPLHTMTCYFLVHNTFFNITHKNICIIQDTPNSPPVRVWDCASCPPYLARYRPRTAAGLSGTSSAWRGGARSAPGPRCWRGAGRCRGEKGCAPLGQGGGGSGSPRSCLQGEKGRVSWLVELLTYTHYIFLSIRTFVKNKIWIGQRDCWKTMWLSSFKWLFRRNSQKYSHMYYSK